MKFERDDYCFVCGEENPKSLKIKFVKKDGQVFARCSFPREYQGYKNIIHGGIIALVLDEAMAHLQGFEERFLTGKLQVRFFSPLLAGEEVEVRAWIEKKRKKVVLAKSEMVKVKDRKKVAEAKGLITVLREE
jgi:acyl-coenzyme A thioesterase PaaI-like protein